MEKKKLRLKKYLWAFRLLKIRTAAATVLKNSGASD